MKAIITKYIPPSNVLGSRITATAEGGIGKPHRVTISYPHEFSGEECHLQAAKALCAKMEWTGELVGGGLPDTSGYAFCFLPEEKTKTYWVHGVELMEEEPKSLDGLPTHAVKVRLV